MKAIYTREMGLPKAFSCEKAMLLGPDSVVELNQNI